MRRLFMAATAAAAALALGGAASADETGLAGIHSWVKIGGRTCFTDHYHYGSGSGPTQAHARAAAIKAWIWPTDLEYGSSWASYNLAASKRMTCKRSGSLWICDTEARPCRRG